MAPLFLEQPLRSNLELQRRLQADATLDVFVVLEANNEFVGGSSGRPPLLALQLPATPAGATGRSFFSRAGGPLMPVALNWAIELRFTVPSTSD